MMLHILLAFSVAGLALMATASLLPQGLKTLLFGLGAFIAALFGMRFGRVFLPFADSTVWLAEWILVLGTSLWIWIILGATDLGARRTGPYAGPLLFLLIVMILNLYNEYHLRDIFLLNVTLLVLACGGVYIAARYGVSVGPAGVLFMGSSFASLGIYSAEGGNIWFPATLALPLLMNLLWPVPKLATDRGPHPDKTDQMPSRVHHLRNMQMFVLYWGSSLMCAFAGCAAVRQGEADSAFTFFVLLGIGMPLSVGYRYAIGRAQRSL